MQLHDHPRGDYRFLTGIAPYSSAVIAQPGFAVVRAHLATPLPLMQGFARIAAHLEQIHRPKTALCGMELRITEPLPFEEFISFNQGYVQTLEAWDILVDGLNPIARTNVAPSPITIAEPSVYAFSYTIPSAQGGENSFVVAGAGDLRDQADLSSDAIVAPGDTSPSGMVSKAKTVMDVMEERLFGLQLDWTAVRTTNLYTLQPPTTYFNQVILPRLGAAALHGVNWVLSQPPIAGLDFEMDLRGVWQDIRLP